MILTITVRTRADQSFSTRFLLAGYRRGRLNSNDCDLIFTHPSSGASQRIDTEMLDKLVENLQKTGEYCGFFVVRFRPDRTDLTDFLFPSTSVGVLLNVLTGSHLTFGGGAPKSSQLVHQRLTILRLPGEGHIRRRVDLIFSRQSSSSHFCCLRLTVSLFISPQNTSPTGLASSAGLEALSSNEISGSCSFRPVSFRSF